MMKKGWEYKKLGEVCKTYAGGTPSKTCKEYYEEGNIPWLRSGEVCRKYIDSTELFITQKGMDNSSAKYYPRNTVVVAMYGATAAQVGILKIESTSNQAVCGILPNERFVPEFLYYWFTCIKDFLASQAQGGAQPNISQVKIKNLTVPIPPLSEQKEIVEYLDSSFAKIDTLKANIAKNLDEAKALFQSALKEALEPKKGWEEKKLGELSSLITKGASPRWQGFSYVDSNGILFVTSENVREGFVSLEPTKYLNKEFNNKQKRSILKYNDLLINIVGASIGRAAIFRLNIKDANINQAVALVRLVKNVDVDYINYILNSNIAWKQYDSLKKDSARANLSLENIRSLNIPIPPLSEQQEIVSRLDSLNEKVNTLQQNYSRICSECDALKQSILRQVFE